LFRKFRLYYQALLINKELSIMSPDFFFHRLNVYPIFVPPLRNRREDIPILAGYFCDLSRRRLGLGPIRISSQVHTALKNYPWPVNVRELENVISRVASKASFGVNRGEPIVLTVRDLGPEFLFDNPVKEIQFSKIWSAVKSELSLRNATEKFQRALIQSHLEHNNNNWSATARALGMNRSNLHHLAIKLGMKK